MLRPEEKKYREIKTITDTSTNRILPVHDTHQLTMGLQSLSSFHPYEHMISIPFRSPSHVPHPLSTDHYTNRAGSITPARSKAGPQDVGPYCCTMVLISRFVNILHILVSCSMPSASKARITSCAQLLIWPCLGEYSPLLSHHCLLGQIAPAESDR